MEMRPRFSALSLVSYRLSHRHFGAIYLHLLVPPNMIDQLRCQGDIHTTTQGVCV